MIFQDEIRAILKEVVNPELNVSIVDEGIVKDIRVEDTKISVILSYRYAGTPLAEYFSSLIKQKIEAMQGVDSVVVEFTGE
ncbi:MAG: iron-sulfur cluster assembly protein [bacterium]|jgi:metal-sulfur cluster biosynthetic enzyme|nr:iron-sulfur cluster assembly protein [bacterium]